MSQGPARALCRFNRSVQIERSYPLGLVFPTPHWAVAGTVCCFRGAVSNSWSWYAQMLGPSGRSSLWNLTGAWPLAQPGDLSGSAGARMSFFQWCFCSLPSSTSLCWSAVSGFTCGWLSSVVLCPICHPSQSEPGPADCSLGW